MRSVRLLFLLVLLTSSVAVRADYFDSDGVRIHFAESGAADGEPVVFIHGYATDMSMWAPTGLPGALGSSHRVIALDCRGHGRSDKPHDPNAYGIEMVRDIARLLDHLDIDRAHLVGYSMGGAIALKFMTEHPDRVISAAPGGFGWPEMPLIEGEPMMERLAADIENGRGFTELFDALRPPGQPRTPPAQSAAVNKWLLSTNDPKALAACARGWNELDLEASELRRNRIPAICHIGVNDGLYAGVLRLQNAMSNLWVAAMPGKDHMTAMMTSQYRDDIARFIRLHAMSKAAAAPAAIR